MIPFFKLFVLMALFFGCSCSDNRYSTDTLDTGGGKGAGGENNIGGIQVGVGPGQVLDKDLELVTHLTERVIAPKLTSLVTSTLNLNVGIEVACNSNPMDKDSLRQYWKQTMLDFHYLNTLAMGPLGENSRSLAERIYSPGIQKVGEVIDDEIEKSYIKGDQYKLKTNKKHLIGLDALEYVFFTHFQESNNPQKGCVYLKAVSENLVQTVNELEDQWTNQYMVGLKSPNGQTQLKELYIKEAVDRLVNFADRTIKDKKLAAPLGLKIDSGFPCIQSETCHVVYLEHPFSLMGKQAMAAHLKALEDIFTSTKDNVFGFSDYINKEPPFDSYKQILQNLPEFEEYRDLFKNYYKVSTNGISEDKTSVIYKSFVELKVLTDWLKVDFLTELNTELPGGVQGDND